MHHSSLLPFEASCHALLQEKAGSKIILGLSGGCDSVALLLRLKEEGHQVYARHLHHGLRGRAADEDALFCRQLCKAEGINYDQQCLNVAQIAAQRGESFELAARELRRDYLLREAAKEGCNYIALAQHADDQAETILFRMARGAAGPRAMRAITTTEHVTWLRPFLDCRRQSIREFLEHLQQTWREDESNKSCLYTRNALRHRVLPALSDAMHRDVIPIINRSAQQEEANQKALSAALHLLQDHFYDPQGRLYTPALKAADKHLACAVIHQYLQDKHISNINQQMVLRAYQLLNDSQQHRVNLPQGKYLQRKQQRLYIKEDQS